MLELKNITKTFQNGKLIANDNISVAFKEKSIHAIIGENGAGKTTLISIIMGLKNQTSGEIIFKDKNINIKNPHQANQIGIGLVPQHIELIENKTVWENVVLGNEITKKGLINKKESIKRVDVLIQKYNFSINPYDIVSKLTLSQKQKVLILKTLFFESEVIIFDEPTSVLSTNEIDELLKSMVDLKKQGKLIIFISHKLKEIMSVADTISVLRRGKLVKTLPKKRATIGKLTDLIIGKKNGLMKYHNPHKPKNKILVSLRHVGTHSVNNVALKNINLDIKSGEIIGILGVDGSGQSELVKVILQRKKKINKESSILIDGIQQMGRNHTKILRDSVSLLPEDRHAEGLVLDESIRNNFFLSRIDDFTKFGFIKSKKQNKFVKDNIEKFDIRGAENIKANVSSLSGGNQQKIIFSRELSKGNKLFIANKPTVGVDVGAIKTIYNNLFEYVNKGNAAIVISDEIEEVVQISHRLVIFFSGEIMGVVSPNTPLSKIGRMMLGEKYEDIK